MVDKWMIKYLVYSLHSKIGTFENAEVQFNTLVIFSTNWCKVEPIQLYSIIKRILEA